MTTSVLAAYLPHNLKLRCTKTGGTWVLHGLTTHGSAMIRADGGRRVNVVEIASIGDQYKPILKPMSRFASDINGASVFRENDEITYHTDSGIFQNWFILKENSDLHRINFIINHIISEHYDLFGLIENDMADSTGVPETEKK